MTIRLLLVDDHAVVRSGIRGFLEQDARLHIIAEAVNGDQALAVALEQKPDVLVLDIQMPGRNGIEVAKAVRAAGLNIGILILTAYRKGAARDDSGNPVMLQSISARRSIIMRVKIDPRSSES